MEAAAAGFAEVGASAAGELDRDRKRTREFGKAAAQSREVVQVERECATVQHEGDYSGHNAIQYTRQVMQLNGQRKIKH